MLPVNPSRERKQKDPLKTTLGYSEILSGFNYLTDQEGCGQDFFYRVQSIKGAKAFAVSMPKEGKLEI